MKSQSTPAGDGNTIKSLVVPTLRTFFVTAVALGIVLFLPAGTLNYWQAWVFIVVFSVGLSLHGMYLAVTDPELLARRQEFGSKSQQSTGQQIFQVVAILASLGLLVTSAFDHRFGWSQMPPYVSVVGEALVVLSFVIWTVVFKENSFAGGAVRTYEGQQVISTGPYALVRHPKYVGDLVLVVGIPLALGSWWGLAFVALTILGLVWRILDEEKLLRRDLSGYVEYTQKVRYRLVPYLW